jgi:hypothetical protein
MGKPVAKNVTFPSNPFTGALRLIVPQYARPLINEWRLGQLTY